MYADCRLFARLLIVLAMLGSLSGCAALHSNEEPELSKIERLNKQAEIKASLFIEDENTYIENTSTEMKPVYEETISPKKREVQATHKQVLFNSEDFSQYAIKASNWLSEVFTLNNTSTDLTEHEVDTVTKPQSLISNTNQASEGEVEVDTNAKNNDLINLERSINDKVIETPATLSNKSKSVAEKVETSKEPILVTEILLLEPSSGKENIKLIAAINTMTGNNPSAAGMPVEVLEHEARSSLESGITKDIKKQMYESSLSPLTGNSKAVKSWGGCAMSSSTIELESPDYTTQMWLNVLEDRLIVNTTTNLDIKLKQVGIKVDGGQLHKFSRNLYASNAVWAADMQTLFNNNKSLKIYIGGDELGRSRPAAEVSMAELKALYLANTTCSD